MCIFVQYRYHQFNRSFLFLKGAQEVFRELPYVYVEPHELKNVAQHGGKLANDFSRLLLSNSS